MTTTSAAKNSTAPRPLWRALWRQLENHGRRRLARRTRQTLEWVDDRTLRDIGLLRSEIGSIASEIAGDTEVTRLRVAFAPR